MGSDSIYSTVFQQDYGEVRDEFLGELQHAGIPSETVEYYRRVSPCPTRDFRIAKLAMQCFDYNVPGGKLNRAMSLLEAVSVLRDRPLTEKEQKQAVVLAWTVEYVRPIPLILR